MITYPVNDIYTCVQGEGVQTGVAMVLLRLQGCAVGCPWCDTKETWDFATKNETSNIKDALGANPQYAYLSPEQIADYIVENHSGPKWVLITGGEPAQYQLRPLVDALQQKGLKTAVETSGTELGHLNANIDWVCVSPKLDMPGGKVVLPEALAIADEIKHVVGKQKDVAAFDQLLETVTLKQNVQLCLQPVSVSPKATQICLNVVQERGWRLSVQMHKFLELP